MVFWKRSSLKHPHNGGYSFEERKYIKSKMEEFTDDSIVKDNLVVWLLQSHPDILGFSTSLRRELLKKGKIPQIPEYDSKGSMVSGTFVFTGRFLIEKEKRFIIRFVDPLERGDGTQLFLTKSVELIVRPEDVQQ